MKAGRPDFERPDPRGLSGHRAKGGGKRDAGQPGGQSLQNTAGDGVGSRRLPGPPRPGRPAPAPRPAPGPAGPSPTPPLPPASSSHFLLEPRAAAAAPSSPVAGRAPGEARPGPVGWGPGKRSAAGWDWLGAREQGSLQEGGRGREVLAHCKLGGSGRPGGDSGHLESIADG